jgi:hypothetical protein
MQTLLSQNVRLPIAEVVLHNTKQFGYELSIQEIAQVTKNVKEVEEFTDALLELPLREVTKLFAIGLSYRNFGTVKASLEKHNLPSSFDETVAVAQKLARTNEYDELDGALQVYSLKEIEQIISNDVSIFNLLRIRNTLEEKQIATNLQETIMFAKVAQDYYWEVGNCIDTFGIDNVRRMVANSVSLSKALEVNSYINGQSRSRWSGEDENGLPESTIEALRKGGVDVIIAIAKAGSIEVAVKTLAAGFSVEEVTRFPYLISSLVAKP